MSTMDLPALRVEEGALPSKEEGRRALLAGLLLGTASAVLTFLLMGLLDRLSGGELGRSAALAVAALPALLLVVGVHEGGHLLAGRLVGFRFALFFLGPVKAYREGGRVRWALNTNLLVAGGAAVSAPAPGDMRDLRRRYWWMVAGGPLASLLLGVAGLAAGSAMEGTPSHLSLMAGGLSLAIAVVTLVPNRLGGVPTDGMRLVLLSGEESAAEQEAAYLGLGSVTMLGHRPRDWDPALVARISAPGEGSTGANAAYFAFLHAMDAGDARSAAAHLQRALDLLAHLPPAQRPMVTLEAAFFEAIVRGDAVAARRWLDASPPSAVVGAHGRLRAEAAVLLAEGRREEALAKAAQAREAHRKSLEAGASAAFDEDLRIIEQRAPFTQSPF